MSIYRTDNKEVVVVVVVLGNNMHGIEDVNEEVLDGQFSKCGCAQSRLIVKEMKVCGMPRER